MKRIIALILALLMFTVLSACGNETSEKVDVDALVDVVFEKLKFDDELSEIGAGAVGRLFSLPEGTEARVFVSSGATSEEVAVFTAEDTDAVVDAVREHLADQKESFAAYIPAEADRIDTAVIVRAGNTVVLVISASDDAAQVVCDQTGGKVVQ